MNIFFQYSNKKLKKKTKTPKKGCGLKKKGYILYLFTKFRWMFWQLFKWNKVAAKSGKYTGGFERKIRLKLLKQLKMNSRFDPFQKCFLYYLNYILYLQFV